jgi:hypothetical protein
MIVGPIIAIALVMSFTSNGPDDMLRTAEQAANQVWDTVATMFRR